MLSVMKDECSRRFHVKDVHMCVPVCVYVYHMCVGAHRVQRHHPTPGAGGQGSWLPCGDWKIALGPLEEQQVLSTTKPSFQPRFLNIKTNQL